MDTVIQFFVDYGYIGMFLSATLAGSIAPFSSELVMGLLQAAGLDPWTLVVVATVGNTAGSLFNYGLGYLGKKEWIARFFNVREDKMNRAMSHVHRYGPLMGFMAWVPFVGEALTLALGLARANLWLSMTTIFIGKFIRYAILMFAVGLIV